MRTIDISDLIDIFNGIVISLGIILLILFCFSYVSKIKGEYGIEKKLTIIVHSFIIPFIIFVVVNIFLNRSILFTIDLLIIVFFLIFDLILRRVRINEKEKIWNFIRAIYFSSFFIMQFAFLHYGWILHINLNINAILILIMILVVEIIFITYLKQYEKQQSENWII